MSSVQLLREFIGRRLTAAALEIFGVCEKTIVEYEEEIARLRKLLETDRREPGPRLRWTEFPQQTLQIKEEQEETCTSQEGEQLVLKQETDVFTWTPDCEGGDHREPEPDWDQQLLAHNSPVAESHDQEGSEHVASGPRRRANAVNSNAEPKPQKTPHKKMSQSDATRAPTKCVTCGRCFKFKYELYAHLKSHAEEKQYLCKICGKRFITLFSYKAHMRLHTGERTYSCQECGEGFDCCGSLTTHMKSHALQRPQDPTLHENKPPHEVCVAFHQSSSQALTKL